jgi:hypothetical protein
MMMKSVSLPPLDPRTVSGTTEGVIDVLDYVDGLRGLFVRIGPTRIPHGAPLLLSGWTVDPTCDLPPAAVAVLLDDAHVHVAETGLSRYDVKAYLGFQTPEMIGFRATIQTYDIPPGDHVVVAFALGSDGRWYEAGGRSFRLYGRMLPELAVDRRRMRLEVDGVRAAIPGDYRGPIPGVVPLGQFALISGWAADRDSLHAPAGVCAIDELGGRWIAPCDLPRPDVRAALGATDDRFGFEIAVPTEGLGRGVHRAELWAFDGGGRRLGDPGEVSFEVVMPMRDFPAFADLMAAPARAQVLVRVRGPHGDKEPTELRSGRTLVVERGDMLELEGWAVLPDGEPGVQAIFELQPLDVAVPPARYHPVGGYRREKPPREFNPPREDAWFSYRLDTRLTSAHTYRLSLAVIAEERCRFARADLGTVRVVETEA